MFDFWFNLIAQAEFWLLLLSFAILMYVSLDGFDLGMGIIYPWFQSDEQRQAMINSIAPFWDGNETWLVFGGVVLFAAFPSAYAGLLSAAYLPIIVMLLALVLRGAAIEYRYKADSSVKWWDRAFAYGSSVVAFCQGFILGQVVQNGLMPDDPNRWGFAIFCGFAVMAGYALLGCAWLILKREPSLQQQASRLAIRLAMLVVMAFAIVSIWSAVTSDKVWQLWFSYPDSVLLVPLPMLCLAIGIWLMLHCRYLNERYSQQTDTLSYSVTRLPYLLTVGLFLLGFIGLWMGMHPYIVPTKLTITEALAPQNSLSFTSVGVVILLPVILSYTAYGYRIFNRV